MLPSISSQPIQTWDDDHAELLDQLIHQDYADAAARLDQLKRSYTTELAKLTSSDFNLLTTLENSKKPDMVIAALVERFCPVELTHIESNSGLHAFENSEVCYLGRTLTSRGDSGVSTAKTLYGEKIGQELQKLAEKEFTLITNTCNFNIVITPATLIRPDTPVDFISSRANRDQWYGLPTVIYSVPTDFTHNSRLSPNADSEILGRQSFSHFQSFASNQAFGATEEEKSKFAEQQKSASPGQMLNQLKSNATNQGLFKTLGNEVIERIEEDDLKKAGVDRAVFTQPRPIDGLKDFSGQLSNWAALVTKASSRERVDHNEVAIRLWPWDLTHVAMAEITPEIQEKFGSNAEQNAMLHALQSAVILGAKRFELAQELLTQGVGKGIEHPVLMDWLTHQNSYDNAHKTTLPQEAVKQKIAMLSDADKKKVALDLASKLLEKVSVIQYTPGQAGFKAPEAIKTLPFPTFYHLALLSNDYMHFLPAAQMRSLVREFNGADSLPSIPHTQPSSELNRQLDELTNLLNDSPEDSILWSGVNLPKDDLELGVHQLKNQERVFVARTLIDPNYQTKPSADADPDSIVDRASRLSTKEFEILSNQLTLKGIPIDLLLTPGTIIKPGLGVQVMSNPYISKLERWEGNPTVIYSLPVIGEFDTHISKQTTVPSTRRLHGHVRSIKSNQAFTDSFNEGRNTRSRAQDLDEMAKVIQGNKDFHIKRDENYKAQDIELSEGPFSMSHDIAKWSSTIDTEKHGPDIPHNEVLVRLWPWDISHVSIGHLPEKASENLKNLRVAQAISCANKLALERFKLAMELCSSGPGKGLNHPVFLDYLSHQMSQTDNYTVNPNGNPDALGKDQTAERIKNSDVQQLQSLLNSLVIKLTENVAVVRYKAGSDEFEVISKQDSELPPGHRQAIINQLNQNIKNAQEQFGIQN